MPDFPPEAAAVLRSLQDRVVAALPGRVEGLAVFGSLGEGDFFPPRSDLDLLCVLRDDLNAADLERLREVHAALAAEFPAWDGRVEVNYLSRAALAAFGSSEPQMARISPGEPLHFTPATRHHTLTLAAARSGVALVGPPPGELLPAIPPEEVRAVVRQHAAAWPAWVEDYDLPGGQAYAVLTLCRALFTVTTGGQASKKAAALWAAGRLPEWASLVWWAVNWWYGGGRDAPAESRAAEVRAFVAAASRLVLAAPEPPAGPGL
ncbi:MAG TPA: aminoglycoside adenylyltransferase domain-containing protein [Deinococcales bacterium]|nr:aminoglycoside adenylyltransferase domain-containing protein [Deinococcales bacterium]